MGRRVAAVVHLDTHVVAWLYTGRFDDLSVKARRAIDREPLAVSPFVRLELQLLHEIGRLAGGPAKVLKELGERVGLVEEPVDASRVVGKANELSWTRDPFDRLIVGHARVERAPLITRDRTIREHYSAAIW